MLGVDFVLTGWTRRVQDAYQIQWTDRREDTAWNWTEIYRRHRDPDALWVAIWAPNERLAGLGLALTGGQAVECRFLEGDPSPECVLKGVRLLIFLEAAAYYAQERGKTELRVQPASTEIAVILREGFGFSLEAARGSEPFYVRAV